MFEQMILTLIFIGLLVCMYIINGKKTKEKDNLPNRYDLIVKFDDSHYVDIKKIESFNKIATWHRYGEYGFRGFSLLKKEELEQFIMDSLGLDESMFHVISTTRMHIPS